MGAALPVMPHPPGNQIQNNPEWTAWFATAVSHQRMADDVDWNGGISHQPHPRNVYEVPRRVVAPRKILFQPWSPIPVPSQFSDAYQLPADFVDGVDRLFITQLNLFKASLKALQKGFNRFRFSGENPVGCCACAKGALSH